MSELFERCTVCRGSRTIPFGTKICDYPASLTPPACPCTLGPTPGWMASGLTVGQFEALRQRNRETEDQLVWLADWCKQATGVENNKVIGCDGWPHRVCEVVAKAVGDRSAKAERFKAFVHDYLTQHGVPEGDPENPHQKEGCRIGARLDLMFAERGRLRAALEELELGQFRSGWLAEAEAIWAARDTTESRNDAALLWAVRCRELLRAMKAAHAAVSEEPALQACPLVAGSP